MDTLSDFNSLFRLLPSDPHNILNNLSKYNFLDTSRPFSILFDELFKSIDNMPFDFFILLAFSPASAISELYRIKTGKDLSVDSETWRLITNHTYKEVFKRFGLGILLLKSIESDDNLNNFISFLGDGGSKYNVRFSPFDSASLAYFIGESIEDNVQVVRFATHIEDENRFRIIDRLVYVELTLINAIKEYIKNYNQ